jgi:multicomponent K+:H+ antiporter subunit E
MRNRHGLALLALILSSIPGTLWVQYDEATGKLLMHVLDLIDEDDWSWIVHHRYEAPLMEIFE